MKQINGRPMPASPSGLPSDVVALIPMRNFVPFPHALTSIGVGRDPSIAALRHALENVRKLGPSGPHA
jgi:ATP-dependent Lon protease